MNTPLPTGLPPPFDRAGVQPCPAGSAAQLQDAALAQGLQLRRLDFSHCTDKAEALRIIAAGLDFPAWFGHNWDALADCLSDLEWLPGNCLPVLLIHDDRLQAAAPADHATLLEIIDEAAASLAAAGRQLIVFPLSGAA